MQWKTDSKYPFKAIFSCFFPPFIAAVLHIRGLQLSCIRFSDFTMQLVQLYHGTSNRSFLGYQGTCWTIPTRKEVAICNMHQHAMVINMKYATISNDSNPVMFINPQSKRILYMLKHHNDGIVDLREPLTCNHHRYATITNLPNAPFCKKHQSTECIHLQ